MSTPLMKVDIPKLNQLYHVSWASNGTVGRCTSINYEKRTVRLRSPKSKVEWRSEVSFDDLRHTRGMEHKINHS